MIGRLAAATLFAVFCITLASVPARAADFPNVVGTWTGSYDVAFAKGHGHYAE